MYFFFFINSKFNNILDFSFLKVISCSLGWIPLSGEFVDSYLLVYPWVVKYISHSLISWLDFLELRVRGFISLGGFVEWQSRYLSFYNLYSSILFSF